MALTLERASPADLDDVAGSVADWQLEGQPVQLHPGDLGWHWRLGVDHLAEALRVWRRGDVLVAVGLVDAAVCRVAVAPAVDRDDEIARAIVADIADPIRGVLPASGTVEARFGRALRSAFTAAGWVPDEPWTPLTRDLAEPVEDTGIRVIVVDVDGPPELVGDRVAVQRAAFPSSSFTTQRWRTMAAASPYRRARCLVGYDSSGDAVAATTVWSAGPGRPGLLEPVGVHRDHRGLGYGAAISTAAAKALRELGASNATVCTPSANVAAVATYTAAGFRRLPEIADFRRPRR